MASRWDKFRDRKNDKRRAMHHLPLERPIKNAMRRARASWLAGRFGTAEANYAKPPVALPHVTVRGAPITFYSPSLLKYVNGFLVRWVQSSTNPSTQLDFVAIYHANTIDACPCSYIAQGHTQGLNIPTPLSVCAYCDNVVFTEHECSTCGAPQFCLPP